MDGKGNVTNHLTGTSHPSLQINGNGGDKTNSDSSKLKHLAAAHRFVETPDSAIFPLIICRGAITQETPKCFLNHP